MEKPATRHRYIRQADTGTSIDALLAATGVLACWGAAVHWVETGAALLDPEEQRRLDIALTEDKYGRHAIIPEPGTNGWGRTLRLACNADDAFAARLLTDRIDARQLHWRPAATPRIDGVRAHLDGGAVIEATWSEGGGAEALLVSDHTSGDNGSWGRKTDRRTGKPIAWPPRAAVEAGVARAVQTARRRATRMARPRD